MEDAPCLAYGNSAVHKPSELSPLSIQVLCEIFQEAGLPEAVYNMVLGYGKEAGVTWRRKLGLARDQTPSSKASLAASTARSTSATLPRAT